MQADGVRTAFPTDAVGGSSKYAHDLAVDRMIRLAPSQWMSYV
jgi:hypothetical protein